jgi:predicted amidohydrolase
MLRVGIIQTTTGIEPADNARALATRIAQLAGSGAELIFTPEMSGVLDRNAARLRTRPLSETSEPTLLAVRQAAADHRVWVALGSLAIAGSDERLRNRSFVIDPDGAVVQTYDKLHLFDVDLGAAGSHRESATYAPGDDVRLARLPWGLLGLSICYDIRFPALYQSLAVAGAAVLAVPAAFTRTTGKAHWHILLRARAIETGSFVVAAAQCGEHADGRQTFGHSLVVDPWGGIVLDMGPEPGVAVVDLDLDAVADARRRIPSLGAARPLGAAQVAP